jgi:uncharacterized membrane protein HdeD (DUF308 family)
MGAVAAVDSMGKGTIMTADVSGSYSGAAPAKHSGVARTAMAVFGGAAVVVGVVLLFNPVAAARTLALLIGLALVIAGCLEMASGWDSDRRAPGLLLGAVLVVGGLLAAFWPGVTLWTIALLTGFSLLVHGLGRTALAVMGRSEIPGWGWLALAGVLNIVVGILALVWPAATVLVLSLVLGFQVLVFGVLVLIAAFSGSRTHA